MRQLIQHLGSLCTQQFSVEEALKCSHCAFLFCCNQNEAELKTLSQNWNCISKLCMVQFDLIPCPPAPPGYTPRELQFFSLLVVNSPPPGMHKETFPYPRAPDRPHVRFFVGYICVVFPYNSKARLLQNFCKRFPQFIERRIMQV